MVAESWVAGHLPTIHLILVVPDGTLVIIINTIPPYYNHNGYDTAVHSLIAMLQATRQQLRFLGHVKQATIKALHYLLG
jgi:hypothetical protein